jgi:hypothetical protein
MKRLIRHMSSRFGHRIAEYSYPQLRPERLRVTRREGLVDEEPSAVQGSGGLEEIVEAA